MAKQPWIDLQQRAAEDRELTLGDHLRKERITANDDVMLKFNQPAAVGIVIGFWDEAELEADRMDRERVLAERRSAAGAPQAPAVFVSDPASR